MIIDLVLTDFGYLVLLLIRSPRALAAETLSSDQKTARLFQECRVTPHRADDATRWVMAALSRWLDWREAHGSVKPDTLSRWHGKGFLLLLAHEIPARRPTSSPRTAAAIYPHNG